MKQISENNFETFFGHGDVSIKLVQMWNFSLPNISETAKMCYPTSKSSLGLLYYL